MTKFKDIRQHTKKQVIESREQEKIAKKQAKLVDWKQAQKDKRLALLVVETTDNQ